MRTAVVYSLAIIGALALLAVAATWLALSWGSGATSLALETSAHSEDGTYVAKTVLSSGGGAAGFCKRAVILRPANLSLSIQDEIEDAEVFHVSCSSQVSLSWKSAVHLEIAYSLLPTGGGASAFMLTHDKLRKVRVSYVVPEA